MYLLTTWFATFLWSGGQPTLTLEIDREPQAVARRLEKLSRGEVLPEAVELAARDDGKLRVCEPRLESLGRLVPEPGEFDPVLLADRLGYTPELLHQATLHLGREKARETQGLDYQLLQAVAASDELVEVTNLLGERVTQWEGLSLPEVALSIRPAALARSLAEGAGREELEKAHGFETAESLGIELDPTAARALEGLARLATETATEQERLASHIETLMGQVAPNVAAVVGSLLGARLLALTGGLARLARMPSSAVQLLGAETALFRHLRTGAKPPKHGAIFQHPLVHQTPPRKRGRAARTLAAKVSIAARLDHFGGEFLGDRLKEQVQARVEAIRKGK